MRAEMIHGDCRAILPTLAADSVNCVVTSPPYWGLRDYGHDGQIGLERTPEAYVGKLVVVFREVRRVLREDGTLWLNLGDSYANDGGAGTGGNFVRERRAYQQRNYRPIIPDSLKPKDMVGIPWRVAFALQADGWWLRSDIIWAKPNPMPESVRDRPTKAHEYVFLLSKAERYRYDAEAIREPDSGQDHARKVLGGQPSLEPTGGLKSPHRGLRTVRGRDGLGRNARTVWSLPTQPYPEAHFATFPPALARRCIRAGCPVGGSVLDPFAGSGTTGAVCIEEGRGFIGIELNPSYVALAEKRLRAAQPPLIVGRAS